MILNIYRTYILLTFYKWKFELTDARKVKLNSLSHVWLFATAWIVAHQAPPSMGFSRQEYLRGLPFPSLGDLPNPGIEPTSPASQADALPSEPAGRPKLLAKGHTISNEQTGLVSVRVLLQRVKQTYLKGKSKFVRLRGAYQNQKRWRAELTYSSLQSLFIISWTLLVQIISTVLSRLCLSPKIQIL